MAYTITGKIKKIFEQQDFPSGFYKQEFVVTSDERFPQDIKMDFLKEKVDLLKPYKEGDSVTVHFDLRGREWNDRYFVDLTAWKIEAAEGESAAVAEEPADKPAAASKRSAPAKSKPLPEDPGNDDFADEDIPF